MKKYGAVVSEDGRFARFPTPEAGIKAQTALITNDYVNKGINTIDAIVDTYLGKGSENSLKNRSGYKTYLMQKTGLSLGQQITAADIPKVTEAMRQFETGQRAPAPTAAPAPKGAPKPLVAIPPKPETPTEGERNAAFLGRTILNNAKLIKKITKEDPNALKVGFAEAFSKGIPFVGENLSEFAKSENRQAISTAQESIVSAALKADTGLAYAKAELEEKLNYYLPKFTDKPGMKNIKQERVKNLIDAVRIKSGRSWTPEMDQIVSDLFGISAAPPSSATTKPSVVQPKANGQLSDADLVNQYLPKPGKR
jgi:hypothetical protein